MKPRLLAFLESSPVSRCRLFLLSLLFLVAMATFTNASAQDSVPKENSIPNGDKHKWLEVSAGIGHIGSPKSKVYNESSYNRPPNVGAKDPFMARLGVSAYPFKFVSVGINADYYGLTAAYVGRTRTNILIALSGRLDFNLHTGNDMLYAGGQVGPVVRGGSNAAASTLMPTKDAWMFNVHAGYRLNLTDDLWAFGEVGYMRQHFFREQYTLLSTEIQHYYVSSFPIMLGLNYRI